MTWQAQPSTRPRFLWLAALSALGLFACSSNGDDSGTGGSSGSPATGGTFAGVGGANGFSGSATGGIFGGVAGNGTGGFNATGGTVGGGVGGSNATGGFNATGGSNATGGTNATGGSSSTGGSNSTGGTSGGSTGGMTGTAGGTSGCTNTNTGVLNEDSSGYVCNNTLGIKGAWYCYSDGSDTSTSCKGTDGKGTGAIPFTAASSAMCLSGTMGTGSGKYAGMGFKLNSGPPGSTAAFGTWNASSIVGFAITLAPGASGKGSGGMVLNVEYPTTADLDPQTKDAPGVTLPGVGSTAVTYNVLFDDSVLANNKSNRKPVDKANLTDVKLAFFPDSIPHSYDFCIKSIVPLMAAPNPVVATGAYGPAWTNQLPQAVNGINGYAVQSAPFPTNGNPMTMQVSATAGGVGFSYTAGFTAPPNTPGAFPAVISGWGPGHDGIQFYGPYKTPKKISDLTSVKSNWTFTMGSAGDAVYDVWFSNAATQPPAVPAIELMVWIGNAGSKFPIGSVANPGTPLSGRTPYVGMNGTGEMVVSYFVDSSHSANSVANIDLLPYFKDAASHAYAGLSNNSYLLGVQTGFEVYSADKWTTSNYNISIQ